MSDETSVGAESVTSSSDNNFIDVDDNSTEFGSTTSSHVTPMYELGSNVDDERYKPCHLVHQIFRREIGMPYRKKQILVPFKTFPLLKVFPQNALHRQIFMGMTRCGRFLMTYSTYMIPVDADWYDCAYHYTLHWWKFEPESLSKEIGNVSLFGNSVKKEPLQLYICQWPKYNDKILVYGWQTASLSDSGIPQRVFVTVTALPSANYCKHCASLKDSLLLGDLSVKSTSNLKCLEHCFTVHTNFDIVVPFPRFHPRVHLKCEDYAVFNTNNSLYSLRISWDSGENAQDSQIDADKDLLSVKVPPSPSTSSSQLQEQIIRDFADDSAASPRKLEDPGLSCLSPPLPTRVKISNEPESSSRHDANHEFLTPKAFLKVKKCCGKRLGFRQFFSRRKQAVGKFIETHSRKSSPYEFVDDSQGEVEKLSQFRRKRLAEKTYEFQECDYENIVPFSTARQGPGRYLSQMQVLRPLNRNTQTRSRCPRLERIAESKLSCPLSIQPRVRVSEGDILVHDISGRYGDLENDDEEKLQEGMRRLGHCFRGSSARFTRRFHDVHEVWASPSPAMDGDDDDAAAATGYHTLLNMEARGVGYNQLRPAPKNAPPQMGIRVEQQSLDIEAICQSVATSLCEVADKTFTFFNDYDVEVIDICPQSGDAMILLMIRIEACEGLTQEANSTVEPYETAVTLFWNLFRGDYRITMVVPPRKTDLDGMPWNPAKAAAQKFRNELPADVTWTNPPVRHCSSSIGVSLPSMKDFDNRVKFVH